MYPHVVAQPVINNAIAQTLSGTAQFTIALGDFSDRLGDLGDYMIVVIRGSQIADTSSIGSGTLLPHNQALNK